jgi:hypothetical protein
MAEGPSGSHRAWLGADERRAQLRGIWQEWFERYDPKLHDAITGPVEEFLTDGAGLGGRAPRSLETR